MNLTLIKVLQELLDGTHEEYLIHLIDLAKNSYCTKDEEVTSEEDSHIHTKNIDLNDAEIKMIYVSLLMWNEFDYFYQ